VLEAYPSLYLRWLASTGKEGEWKGKEEGEGRLGALLQFEIPDSRPHGERREGKRMKVNEEVWVGLGVQALFHFKHCPQLPPEWL